MVSARHQHSYLDKLTVKIVLVGGWASPLPPQHDSSRICLVRNYPLEFKLQKLTLRKLLGSEAGLRPSDPNYFLMLT